MIGNSSSAVREGAFIGTPSVNVGSRQQQRVRGKNLIDVENDKNEIIQAIQTQLKHGKYERDSVYGSGKTGPLIAKTDVDIQKVICY